MFDILNDNVKKVKRLKKSKVEGLASYIEGKMSEYERIRPEIVKIYAEADELGALIYEEGLETPAEIFEKFHNGQRRQPLTLSKESFQI